MRTKLKNVISSSPSVTTSISPTTETSLFSLSPKPWKPHAGQRKGIKYLLEHAAAGVLADPGVGKTTIVYGALKILFKKGLARKVLVVAPLRVCYMVWPAEQAKWADFSGFRVAILHGPKKQEALESDADIYLINPEGLDWLLGAKRTTGISGRVAVTVDLRGFRELGFDTLVVDELTKFKHHSSGRHKALKAITGTFGRRWGLTGTPAPNGLMDLFGQCLILDEGRTLGRFITHYRSEYFVPSADGSSYNLQRGAAERIYRRIKPLMLRLDAADYIDMPEHVDNYINFDLPEKALAIYKRMEEELLTKVGSNLIVAANAGAASMKCRQVANGAIYLDLSVEELLAGAKVKTSKREWAEVHGAKLDALGDLVEELQGSPLLVAYDFHHDLERLQAMFGTAKRPVPYIGSGVSPKKASEIEARWNEGRIPLLFGHPGSVGHGLNLQAASNHVCWFAGTWDYELYDQFCRRVRRQGNKAERVFVHHLIARRTVDLTMSWARDRKGRGQQALLDALKKMAKERK